MRKGTAEENKGDKMLTCRICGANCDPSDLVNGVCDDCREAEQKEQERKQDINRLLKSDGEQMRLEEFWI